MQEGGEKRVRSKRVATDLICKGKREPSRVSGGDGEDGVKRNETDLRFKLQQDLPEGHRSFMLETVAMGLVPRIVSILLIEFLFIVFDFSRGEEATVVVRYEVDPANSSEISLSLEGETSQLSSSLRARVAVATPDLETSECHRAVNLRRSSIELLFVLW